MSRPALFLDRDGVINIDHAYVHRREDFDFVDGIFDLVRTARERGYLVFVITNQAGIGRGKYTEADFHTLTEWMSAEFAARGAAIDKVYFCPYHAEHGVGVYKQESPFRKPNPGMILQAAQEFDVDLAASVLLGDMETDIQAGRRAGVGRTLLFAPPDHPRPDTTLAHAIVSSHAEVHAHLPQQVAA
ncbi:MAG: D-glycero-alpha-D-manno-heptose-1,7-bisphosphate 7-phosphatase [Rhizobacter sp.]